MYYKLLPYNEADGKLYIPLELAEESKFSKHGLLAVYAGHRKQAVEIIPDHELKSGELKISRDVIETLMIPHDIKYQVKLLRDGIRIGPVIGLLMARNIRNMSKGMLSQLSNYTLLYPEIQGLLVIFSVGGIDFDKQTVEGYYYAPQKNNEGKTWRKGVFPLPDSIFQRVSMPDEVRRNLKKITGNRMFNSYYFDKWQFWKMMSRFESVCEHIPYTRYYSTFADIDKMLDKFDSVYLKPVNGTLARGIAKISKEGENYKFQVKQDNDPVAPKSREEAESFVKGFVKHRGYIVQQALNPLRINGRHTDFRVIMQKDQTKQWICTGIISFMGNAGSIVSNWGDELTFEDTFTRHLNFNQKDVFKIRQEIIDLCSKVCQIIDRNGENYGDIGFDVLVDDKFKVWVLEGNKRHYHSVPLWIGDAHTFYAVKANPVKYAAGLSGFNVY